MPNSLPIMFACNNPDNGHFQGWFESVSFGDVELEGPRTRITQTRLRARIGRQLFAYKRWSEWVGNWCWDEIEIHNPLKLFAMLQKRGFTCHAAPTEFFEAWNRGDAITEELLLEVTDAE